MQLPFNVEDFLTVFEKYNQAVFPMHVLLYLLAVIVIYLSAIKRRWTDKTISGILSFFWIWMGIMYHVLYFASINKAAYLFGGLFLLQGVMFLWNGVYRNKLSFRLSRDQFGFASLVFFLFALLIYPSISYFMGHSYPASPTFGLPCPTTIFTFGVFLTLDKRYPIFILIIPFVWALIGFSAAFSLGIQEDISLLIAAVITAGFLISKQKNLH